jgi:hypothetical protein
MYDETEIRGEYWIQDGQVDFADGDIGDRNHEMIARDHIFNQYSDEIISLADDLEISTNFSNHYGEIDTEELSRIISEIEEKLEEQGMDSKAIDPYIMEHLGCNRDAYLILRGGGDERMYAMKYEGWIAVRGMNVELYGYDETRRQQLVHGLSEILDQEGIDESIPPDQLEFSIDDHKTNRSHSMTLAELEEPISMKTSIMPQTVKKVPIPNKGNKDSEENKGQSPSPSVPNPWNKAAVTAGIIPPGHELWRGTSENVLKFKTFSEWLEKRV